MAREKSKKAQKKKNELSLTICEASKEMIEKTVTDGVSTVFERAQEMKPCPEGICCRNCFMGPCRLSEPKKQDEGEEKKRVGICGATIETITARNFVRVIAAGASAHSDHGRKVAEVFLAAAKGGIPN